MVLEDKKNIQESRNNEKSNNTVSAMLCTGAGFVMKNFFIAARTVLFDTADLHLLTFRILEPYPSKGIQLNLRHPLMTLL